MMMKSVATTMSTAITTTMMSMNTATMTMSFATMTNTITTMTNTITTNMAITDMMSMEGTDTGITTIIITNINMKARMRMSTVSALLCTTAAVRSAGKSLKNMQEYGRVILSAPRASSGSAMNRIWHTSLKLRDGKFKQGLPADGSQPPLSESRKKFSLKNLGCGKNGTKKSATG